MDGRCTNQHENRNENANNVSENEHRRTRYRPSSGIPLELIPIILPNPLEPDELVQMVHDDENSVSIRSCSLCSKSDKNMYSIRQNHALVEEVINRLKLDESETQPLIVCSKCNKLLSSMAMFRVKAEQTLSLLKELADPFVTADEPTPPPGPTVVPVITGVVHMQNVSRRGKRNRQSYGVVQWPSNRLPPTN